MAKLTLASFASLQSGSAISALNNNFAEIISAFENTLSRDGTSPNYMSYDLDMNSNRISNLVPAIGDTEPVRLKEFQDGMDALEVIVQDIASTTQGYLNSVTTIYDSFDDRYLGPKASDPTTDNDGNTLLTGAIYWNTSTNIMKVWDGSQWTGVISTTSGFLLDDLGDVAITSATTGNVLRHNGTQFVNYPDSNYAASSHTHPSSQITDFNEAAQDAVGAIVNSTLVYTDGTPLLERAAITGHITIASGSNTAALGSFTAAQLDAAVSDANVSYTTHTHLLAAGATDVTITAANLNTLDDGVNTSLHFHDADRARSNHTGTQLSTTISDFNEAAQDAVGGILTTSSEIALAYNDVTPSISASIVAGSIDEAKLDTSVNASLDLADSASQPGHTHTLSNVSDVTMTVANLNSLDDGANTTLHFHNTDRDRANHTGTQLASTISDFSSAVTTVGDAVYQPLDTFLTDIAALTGPGADRILFWDDSLGAFTWLTIGTNLVISGTTLNASGGGGGGGLSDGDFGDITVSSAGTVMTIDNDVVTFAKMQNIATARFLGRLTAGSGDIEELTSAQIFNEINNLTTGSSVALSDIVPFYNVGINQSRGATVTVLLSSVDSLTEDTAPDGANDFLLSYDTSATTPKKVKPDTVLGLVNGLTADASPAFGDYILSYDSSASAPKKILGTDVRKLFEGTVVLASDNTVSTTALADVTGMSFTADASSTYIVELIGTFQTAATTTGIGLALNIPSGGVMGQVFTPTSSTAVLNVLQIANNAVLAPSTGVAAANTNYPITAKWLVKIDSTGGTVQLRQRSEVAASNSVLKAGTATIPGTVMTWKKVA